MPIPILIISVRIAASATGSLIQAAGRAGVMAAGRGLAAGRTLAGRSTYALRDTARIGYGAARIAGQNSRRYGRRFAQWRRSRAIPEMRAARRMSFRGSATRLPEVRAASRITSARWAKWKRQARGATDRMTKAGLYRRRSLPYAILKDWSVPDEFAERHLFTRQHETQREEAEQYLAEQMGEHRHLVQRAMAMAIERASRRIVSQPDASRRLEFEERVMDEEIARAARKVKLAIRRGETEGRGFSATVGGALSP
jgi:hypothetical protein